jgi:hypothetical protein
VSARTRHNTLFSRPSLNSDARMKEKTVAVATTLHPCSWSSAFWLPFISTSVTYVTLFGDAIGMTNVTPHVGGVY